MLIAVSWVIMSLDWGTRSMSKPIVFRVCSGRAWHRTAGEGIEWGIVLPVIGFMLVGITATFFFKKLTRQRTSQFAASVVEPFKEFVARNQWVALLNYIVYVLL